MTDILLPSDKHDNPIQALAPGASQTLALTGSSAVTTNPLSKNTVVVRLVATQPCFVKIATGTPTATTSDMYLPAGIPEYFAAEGIYTLKIAALQVSLGGTLYITEMA